MKSLKSLLFLFLLFSLISCGEEDNITNPDGSGNSGTTFIVIQNIGDESTKEYAISKMSFSGETAKLETLISLQMSAYPYDFIKDVRIDGDKLYIYSLLPDYKSKLVAFDINTKQIDTLPWAKTNNDKTWSAFSRSFDAKNSYVHYIMTETSTHYNDWPGSYLCRYNITTGDFIQMANPIDFTVSQPEKGWDTETGSWSSVHATGDGTGCVGSIMAWGVDGGSNHYDYNFLYRYNPDNTSDKLTRIGTETMKVYGATNGAKYLYQYNQLMNTETDTYFELSTISSIGADYTGFHNENGVLRLSNYYGKNIYIYYQDLENDVETLVVETKPEIQFAQMDKSGSFIWFGLEGKEENILCKTQDLSEGSVVDTVARYPKSVYGAILK
jgi:hypothetical protein